MATLTLASCSQPMPSLLRWHPVVALLWALPENRESTCLSFVTRWSERAMVSYSTNVIPSAMGKAILRPAVSLTTSTFEVSAGVSCKRCPLHLDKDCCGVQRSLFYHFVAWALTHAETSCYWRPHRKPDTVCGCRTWKQACNTKGLPWLLGDLLIASASSSGWASQLFLSGSSVSSAHTK